VRWLACILVAAVDVLLLVPRIVPTRGPAWIHPVVPPLTRVAALGDRPLVASTGAGPGASVGLRPADMARLLENVLRRGATPAQQAELSELRRLGKAAGAPAGPGSGPPAAAMHGMELRLAMEEDATALAGALGPDRVALFLAQKELLSDELGEGAVWDRAARGIAY
jgi:hypothetical protein